MTPAEIRAAFSQRALGASAILSARLRNASLPEAVDALAQSKLAIRLDGIRLALVSWTPRPPLAPQEEAGFFAVLNDAIERQVDLIVTELIEQRFKVGAVAQSALMEWQRAREAWSDRPTREAVAAMKDADPVDDTLQVVNLGGGKFVTNIRLREDPEDIKERERIARRRAERAAQANAEQEGNGQ
jgi:hypothetical protein